MRSMIVPMIHNAQIGFVEIEAAAVVAVEPLVAAAAE